MKAPIASIPHKTYNKKNDNVYCVPTCVGECVSVCICVCGNVICTKQRLYRINENYVKGEYMKCIVKATTTTTATATATTTITNNHKKRVARVGKENHNKSDNKKKCCRHFCHAGCMACMIWCALEPMAGFCACMFRFQ